MAVRRRRSTASLALTAALGVSAALLLSACGPDEVTAGGTPASSAPAVPATPAGGARPTAAGSAKPTASAPTSAALPAHGTGVPHLTLSNGGNLVLLDNATVDFHTQVRDLAWSPDGSKAVFIDGHGNLVTSNPDGTGQHTLATNPGGQTWSHPAWKLELPSEAANVSSDNIVFTIEKGGHPDLYQVPADGAPAAPAPLPLGVADPSLPQPQQHENTWANVAGTMGLLAYENTADGQVYIRDDYLRLNTYKLTAGSEPAPSRDDKEVAFVRSVGGHDHLFAVDLATQALKDVDLTPNATTDYTEPSWSPDGKQLVARTPDGLVLLAADGSQAPHKVAGNLQGLPAFRA
ncbi:hypothetical protein ACFYNO_19545 [Kitasatospora sp. NPDC006697]|uniref:hypothetical protein n=1 Tax=Kitasatospora sp. NPDC006697 TaxID=3364020 RepID=UPI0036A991CA